eukprot:TRINITY_DN22651_c0_g1_i1.p1 TRINITY_DN22651_c0_g1~~TRINITY_DN22651_c0_g1_i1.p1  ORF type:complete len:204 (+),score=18.34 TRINITY_DN22651_c0_g1_i1:80-613(+)
MNLVDDDLVYSPYSGEEQLPEISAMFAAQLSEPYSVFTYRFFLDLFPHLCFLAHNKEGKLIGCVMCKIDKGRTSLKGYLGMLAVDQEYRKRGIATVLVKKAINEMKKNCHEVMLETEVCNIGAQKFYEKLGFIKDKRLSKYYLNGSDAFRLKLFFKPHASTAEQLVEMEEEAKRLGL